MRLFCSVITTTLLLFASISAQAQETATVEGTVTDAQDGSPLTGVNVFLVHDDGNIGQGAATDTEGRYRIARIRPGTYEIVARYVGYRESRESIELTAGAVQTMNLTLEAGGIDLETVVISASRRQEKIVDAPASVTVLPAREIEQTVSPTSVVALRNTTGVDMAQTGIDRHEVVLRGFNNAFSGATYVLTDYRQAAVPSLAVNVHSIMPAQSTDIDRVEVVRGPGSALYGPGVDAGVIYFVTKDPFMYPGTTVSIGGGERSMMSGQLRHAGAVSDRFGYKITASYASANDWELDPNDPHDAAQLDGDVVYDNPSAAPPNQIVDPATGKIQRNTDYERYNANGSLEYRFSPETSLVANVGLSSITGTVLSGIGTVQADNFGYYYGQLRLQSGGFFAQAYVNRNDAGNSYVYGSGQAVVDKATEYVMQAQYDLSAHEGRQRLVIGADVEFLRPNTEGSIIGRNEGETIDELGAYAQSTTTLTDELDVVLALRADYNNVTDIVQLSPRAGLVYRIAPDNSLRATFNRAVASPGTNSLFLDIPAQVTTFDGTPFRIQFQGRGSAHGFTFNEYRQTGAVAFSLPVPGAFGMMVPLSDLPLAPVYGAAAGGGLVDFLLSGQPLPDPLPALSEQQRQLLAQLLGYTAQQGSLGSASTDAVLLGIPDDSERGYQTVSGPTDIDPLRQPITNTFEVGYKGVLADRVLVGVDAYYSQKSNFVGPLSIESPLAYLQQMGLSEDVGEALGVLFATTDDATIQQLLQGLNDSGLPPEVTAQILAGLVGGAMADTPTGIVQPDQDVLPEGTQNAVGGFLAYRNFGKVRFYGFDVSIQALLSENTEIFGNLSWVSDDFFDNEELDEDNPDLAVALNAPSLKFRLGGSHRFSNGLSFNASGRYTEGFPVRSGPYVGSVDSYFLVDLAVGYELRSFASGMRFDLGVQNVLDNKHREFVGAPAIGRLILGRLTVSM